MNKIIPIILLLFLNACNISARQTPAQYNIDTGNPSRPLEFSPPFVQEGENADIELYRAGVDKFELDPPPLKETPYYMRLTGKSDYPYLWVQINKRGSAAKRNIMLWLDSSKEFDKYYLFKEGPGLYEISIFGTDSLRNLRYQGLVSFSVNTSQSVPEDLAYIPLNKEVLDFAISRKGERVGRGECWDLVQEPLDIHSADWPRSLEYGLELNPARDEIKPGDIIQFRSVRIVTEIPGVGTRTEIIGMPDHTAVVYEVLGENRYKLLHQNINGKRYVIETENDFSGRVSGSIRYFRPIAGLLNPAR
jgi:hypothetical protein